MNFITSTFNNRELALIIWLGIFLTWYFFQPGTLHTLGSLIKSFFAKKIFVSVLAMTAYLAVFVFLLYKIGLWNTSMLKDTLVWFLGGGFVLHLRITKIKSDDAFFKNFIIDTVKFVAIIEFILNFYTFGLIVELILFPVIVLIVISNAFIETHHEYKDNEQYRPVLKMNKVLLNIIGYTALIYFGFKLIQNFGSFSNIQTIKNFLLPILLSLSSLFMMYATGLYMFYEELFIRLSFRLDKNPPLLRYLKWRVVLICNIRLLRVQKFYKAFQPYGVNTKDAADFAIKRALVKLKTKK